MFGGFGTNPNTTRTTGYRQNHPTQKRPSNLGLMVVLVLSGPLALLERLLPVEILPLVDSGWIPNGFYWTL